MSVLPVEPGELVALGAFAGAQVLVACFSLIVANAYRERALLVHAVGTVLALACVQLAVGGKPFSAQAAMLLLLAADLLQLRELVSHAGALRQLRRLLVATSLGFLPVLAVAGWAANLYLLLPAVALWVIVVVVIMSRAWPQSQPWARWLVPGQLALAASAALLGWLGLNEENSEIPMAALLSAWAACVFLATTWRNRIFNETRVKIDARNMTDPLTGLLMPIIFYDRVKAVRNLMTRYGHPSVIILVHVENLQRIAAECGPEVAESALPVAANRIRETLREGDVAARLSHSRIAVLAEGMGPPEASANLASRILVAGMKEPLPLAPGEFPQMRMVLAAVPVNDIPPKALLQRMSDRLDEHLRAQAERRIQVLTGEELQLS